MYHGFRQNNNTGNSGNSQRSKMTVCIGSLLTTFEVSSFFEAAGPIAKIEHTIKSSYQVKLI